MSAAAPAPGLAAAVVLAAGASRRMGRCKLLLPVGGRSLLAEAVAPLLASRLAEVVVVLGSDAEQVRSAAGLPEDPRLRLVLNPAWREGMAASLRRGLQECAGAGAVLVALADQLGVDVPLVEELLAAWRSGARLVVPVHAGRSRHPVLFDRSLFSELSRLEGDRGARDLVRRHRADLVQVAAPPARDIDTESDYEDLLAGRPPRDGEGFEI